MSCEHWCFLLATTWLTDARYREGRWSFSTSSGLIDWLLGTSAWAAGVFSASSGLIDWLLGTAWVRISFQQQRLDLLITRYCERRCCFSTGSGLIYLLLVTVRAFGIFLLAAFWLSDCYVPLVFFYLLRLDWLLSTSCISTSSGLIDWYLGTSWGAGVFLLAAVDLYVPREPLVQRSGLNDWRLCLGTSWGAGFYAAVCWRWGELVPDRGPRRYLCRGWRQNHAPDIRQGQI